MPNNEKTADNGY